MRANADIRIGALAAGNNIELLEKQVREFRPALVSVQSKDKADALRIALSDFNCKIVYGMDGLIAVATYEPAELVVTAIVGMIGIRPTIEAIKAGKDIALANKETLVTAGHLIMKLAEEYHVRILPVDSEHSAIFQCLHGEREFYFPSPLLFLYWYFLLIIIRYFTAIFLLQIRDCFRI